MENELTLEILEKIAYTEINDYPVDQHDCFLIELIYKEMFYYLKIENNLVKYNCTIDSFRVFLWLLINSLSNRKTDMMDSLYLLYFNTNGHIENDFTKTHRILLEEINLKNKNNILLELYDKASVKLDLAK